MHTILEISHLMCVDLGRITLESPANCFVEKVVQFIFTSGQYVHLPNLVHILGMTHFVFVTMGEGVICELQSLSLRLSNLLYPISGGWGGGGGGGGVVGRLWIILHNSGLCTSQVLFCNEYWCVVVITLTKYFIDNFINDSSE